MFMAVRTRSLHLYHFSCYGASSPTGMVLMSINLKIVKFKKIKKIDSTAKLFLKKEEGKKEKKKKLLFV